MRRIVVGVAIVFVAVFTATAAARDYVVRGVTDPAPDLLAQSLAADDGLLLLTSPLTTRKAFLAGVTARATLALQHAGYADAKATVTIEQQGVEDRVVVDVAPGPRRISGAIEVSGLPEELAVDLRAWLKSPRPPEDAVPQAVDTGDGWSGVRWVDGRGQPATLEPPLWSRGQPAPCDPHQITALRAAIARFLRDHGHFTAARGVEKPQASGPRCAITLAPHGDETSLVVSFADLPPPAVLREIEVAPASRTTAAILGETLGLHVGTTVTEHDRLAWQEALRATGRFVKHEVKFRELRPGPDGVAGIVAIFDLVAYPPVAPLGQPLTREEEAMLRCRSWLLETLANDDDLVATWTRSVADTPLGSLVISTREGVLLVSEPGSEAACGLAASGGGLGCFLPKSAGRFEFPLPVRMRAVVDVAFALGDTVEQGRHTYPRTVTAAASFGPRPRDATAAVALAARIEPVACLSLLHEDAAVTSWEDGTLVVTAHGSELRIDATAGRLHSLRLADGGRIDVDAGPGRLAAAVAAFRESSGDDGYRDEAPVSSAVTFLTGDAVAGAIDGLAAAAGVRPQFADWLPVIAAVGRNLRETVARGGFAVADARVTAALDTLAIADASALPVVPTADAGPSLADPIMAVASLGASHAWRWLDGICGGGAWPCGLARIAALAARHDSTGALWEVTSFMADPHHGPLAHLVAARTIPIEAIAVSFARQGQSRLSTAAFHADCDSALAVLRDCGLDRCGVSLLRSLDDDEARAAGAAWLHDPDALLPLVRDVRSSASEEAAVADLPAALDRWWETTLRPIVTASLAAKAGPDLQTAETPAPESTPRR